MFKNMERKTAENGNLSVESIESSEEKSNSVQEQGNNNNLTITIPKHDNNVFLKYDYDELLNGKLDKLNVACEEYGNDDKILFSREKKFAEDNYPSGNKKQILLFKQLKNVVKSKVCRVCNVGWFS